MPLIVGPANIRRGALLNPLDEIFGHSGVLRIPALGSSMPLANLLKVRRVMHLDDFRPVEYAASQTIPVNTFLSLFQGQPIEVAVSQSFHDGNVDACWNRGVAMTAKLEGLWDR